MRILHLIYDSVDNPWLGGGGAHRTHNIYKHRSEEVQVLVICGGFPGAAKRIDGIRYIRVGVGPNYAISRLSFFLLAPLVVWFYRSDVFVEDVGMPAPLFLAFLKKKAICSVQFIPTEAYRQKRKAVGWFLTWLFKVGLKRYKKFVTVSDYAKEQILAINKRATVTVIPNGINLPEKVSSGQDYMLYLGRIDLFQKGIDILLEALAALKAQHILTKFVIAGPGESGQVEELERLIADYALQDQVTYIGAVSGQRKAEVLSGAKFLVLPSRNETFGIVALEGFSYGKSVVASNVGGLGDLISESGAGVLVKSGDSKSLARAITELLNKPRGAKELGMKGAEYAKQFTWAAISRRYFEYIEKGQ